MCGIVGYTGPREASPILVEGLRRLEYRGYDSAGLAIENGEGIGVRKVSGPVANLADLLRTAPLHGSCGIGHTRWATHGPPTDANAHPHHDCTGRISLVHNGIIENNAALRVRLERDGHEVRTPTDTEVLAHLIEEAGGTHLEDRVARALTHVEGTYGIAVLSADEPGRIVVARRGSPVLLGIGDDGELFVASDPSPILGHTRTVIYLEDGDLAVLTPDGYTLSGGDGEPRDRDLREIEWDLEAIELGDHDHFMQKEIFEQPGSITDTLRGRLLEEEGVARLDGLNLDPSTCRNLERIVILACGTSWHAGLIGREVLEALAGIPVQVEYASEFRYGNRIPLPNTLAVAVSQSGETADTLEAMRAARESGARLVGIVNVVGSTIAREADGGIYLHAGPEIGVASTKAFTSQLAAFGLLGLHLAEHRGVPPHERRTFARALARIPERVAEALEVDGHVRSIASELAGSSSALYLGRGVNFPIALEGALKLKEVSYVHAEGYPAAEMKHGPIALVDDEMPVVFVAPCDDVYPKVVGNIEEVRARGGRTVVVTTHGNGRLDGVVDHRIQVPAVSDLLSPLVTVVPLQLLAYHIAVLRGCDVDRPRNLAKSVTVE